MGYFFFEKIRDPTLTVLQCFSQHGHNLLVQFDLLNDLHLSDDGVTSFDLLLLRLYGPFG